MVVRYCKLFYTELRDSSHHNTKKQKNKKIAISSSSFFGGCRMRNYSIYLTHPLLYYCRFQPKTSFINLIPILSIFTFTPSSLETPFLPTHDLRQKRREFAQLLQLRVPNKPSFFYKTIHGQMLVLGFQSDVYLTNILLHSYSKSDCLQDAKQLFDKMPERNLITWSSIISMHTQHNHGQEALLLFCEFQKSCLENPNEFILASVLRACTLLGAVEKGTQVHDLVIKAGFDQDVYVGTSLIDFYSKNGEIEVAKLVFDDLPVKTAVTWTTIIVGYSQSGMSEVSLKLFTQMRDNTKVIPDRFVLSSAISACSALEWLGSGKQIHAYVLRNGVDTDISVINVLIDFYSKCHRVKIAKKLFDQMAVKNVVSWTTMIAGFMQNSCDRDAMKHFFEMTQLGWRPDGFTCTSILTSCGSLQALEQGRQVHTYTIKTSLELDDYVKNGLIDMYAKCGSLVDAKRAFDVITEHNVISYNAMIEGYASQYMLSESLDLFKEMRLKSLHPTLLTFVSLLGLSASLCTLELSQQIHGLIMKFGVSLDLYVGSALVDVYSKCLCIEDARIVFEKMIERDIVVWNAMVSGYTLNEQGEEALKLFLKLQLLRMKPNEFTYVALLTASSSLASLVHGQQFHNQLVKTGLDLEPYVSNALVGLYARCGSIKDAQRVFDGTHQRDVVCWNAMISRYAEHGHAQEALQMFDRMCAEGIEPNYVTSVGVLSACSHVGLVETGLHHLDSMVSVFGIEPGVEHYACVVTLLGRAGKLERAKEFIEQMPIEPAAIVWRSLLSACRIVGNVDMGKYAAEMAISLDPKDSGSYVLLSNILASKGMWADVDTVRKKMKSNEVTKEPGHSWIEIDTDIHVFIARDKAHNCTDLIYSVLDKLTRHIKGVGANKGKKSDEQNSNLEAPPSEEKEELGNVTSRVEQNEGVSDIPVPQGAETKGITHIEPEAMPSDHVNLENMPEGSPINNTESSSSLLDEYFIREKDQGSSGTSLDGEDADPLSFSKEKETSVVVGEELKDAYISKDGKLVLDLLQAIHEAEKRQAELDAHVLAEEKRMLKV